MPGLDGYAVCRQLRANDATAVLPVIMVTSSIGQEKKKAIEAGADDFIPKPFNHDELLTRVRSLLRIKRYHDTIKAQAAELAELNRTLESRVQTQVGELERLRRLRRFLSPQLADAVVSSQDETILHSHRRQVAMFFADLRGWTSFVDAVEPEEKDRQIEELRASRKRLVLAAAADRGRIERELHDGPQQRLVALAVELQQARRLVDVHPAAAGVLIDEIAGEVQEALDALRALAHRIHPPLLEAGGLRAALRTTAAMLDVPTRVQVPAGATLPSELAGAVYFSCADALEQLGERAKIAITVRQEEGTVVFEIVAEGSDSATADADLTPMRDRVEALGGRLTIESEPGHSRHHRLAADLGMNLAVLSEVEDHGLDPPVNRRLPRQPELEEDRVNHLLDRTLGQEERLGDGRVVLPFGHLAQHVALARRQLIERGVVAPTALRDEGLDDLGVDHGAALCDRADCADELVDVLHPLLEEVGATRATAVEEREGIARIRVLAEHDDADVRVRLAQPLGSLDPLVGIPGRHPDVGDDDVRPLRVDRVEKGIEIVADGGDLDVGHRLEQTLHAFADEVVIVRQHDPNRHG